jgi:hypothetical protein
MFGARAYAFVESLEVRERSGSKPGREFTRRFLRLGVVQLGPVGFQNLFRDSMSEISRKEHLQGALTRLTSRTHNASGMKDEAEPQHPSLGLHSSSFILF